MNTLILTGLEGTNPLAVMAAFGLLRCCQEIACFSGVRLAWQETASLWRPVLHLDQPIPKNEFCNVLSEHLATASQQSCAGLLALVDEHAVTEARMAPSSYAAMVRKAQEACFQGNRGLADWLLALASDMVLTGKGDTKPSPLCMTSGSQQFFPTLQKCAASMNPMQKIKLSGAKRTQQQNQSKELARVAGHFEEALFGPWRYADNQHSLGWDVGGDRAHALMPIAPTKLDHCGVLAAVWLAIESLPLFPTVLTQHGLATACFEKQGQGRNQEEALLWPIWTRPVSIDTLRCLLLQTIAWSREPRSVAARRSIEVFYRAKRVLLVQGRATFKAAEIVA
ncbi:type I-G CRISPR-associated protein, Cas3-extension family [Megalodesulfovibrio gigas]|uniref:Uncharacterized protein n=1 Tax=Megalodesulfovibrio gigas (strain ATCC 19364 / DSM 1382 / NCIMB 9332 / VKM B-1759) TaxID=1121448 RepID=T2GC95_MEGG1|nr:hypothetical protein [Megalodesulfovibrio gigas]AGW14190.1 hypothetical protein DGI_2447 [Megalodesulfovibrio gigas DSM 1382 = ATCC 19364]